ncbi:MAG: peptide deformylase [Oligoflexia bacterium]|nr:peptide deformylase [Oligoflexia bacterium]
MSVLDIKKFPDPILRQVATPVTEFDTTLRRLVDDMIETMYVSNGVGLAAPQIGVSKRIAVVDVSEDRTQQLVVINPTIVSRTGSDSAEEGCLSIPEYRDTVTRSKELKLQAFDHMGKQYELDAQDLLARCLQHEIDHLDGVLFIDHLSRLKRDMFRRWFKKRAEA